MPSAESLPVFITPDALREHWQGHRRLTRRVINAFPADKLFTHSVAGMRTMGELGREMLGMAEPTVEGMISDSWGKYAEAPAQSREELLAGWDKATAAIDARWKEIPVAHFQDTVTAFGQWTMKGYEIVLYLIDNEIHHRGQGYVYLRSLGIEPPPFYERS